MLALGARRCPGPSGPCMIASQLAAAERYLGEALRLLEGPVLALSGNICIFSGILWRRVLLMVF